MNKFFKKTLTLFGCVTMLLSAVPTSVFATTPTATPEVTNTPFILEPSSVLDWPTAPSLDSDSVVLMDLDSGTVLASQNADAQQYPAGLTKLMTALVAMENANLFDYITFSENAVHDNEDQRWVCEGEKMSLEDCLYALMLSPSNEISIAIAEHISGDVDSFVALMNQKAVELGCTGTNFANPNGLHDENHYSTAHDMALIAQAAYNYPRLQQIFRTKEYIIEKTNKTDEERKLNTRHQMLLGGDYQYEFCTGGKNGFTAEAQNSLATYAEQNGRRLVCIALNAEDSADTYKDTKSLFNYGFDNFENITMYKSVEHLESRMLYPNLFYGQLTTLETNTFDCILTVPLTAPSKDIKSEIVVTDNAILKQYKYNGYIVGTQKTSTDAIRTILTQKPQNVPGNPSTNIATPTPDATGTQKNIFQTIPWFVYVLVALVLLAVIGFVALYLWVSYQRELLRKKRLKRKRQLRKQREAEERQRQYEEYIATTTPRRRKNSSYYSDESTTPTSSRRHSSSYYEETPTASSRRRSSSYYEETPTASSRRRSSSYYEETPTTSSRRRSSSYYEEASATTSSRRSSSSSRENTRNKSNTKPTRR